MMALGCPHQPVSAASLSLSLTLHLTILVLIVLSLVGAWECLRVLFALCVVVAFLIVVSFQQQHLKHSPRLIG